MTNFSEVELELTVDARDGAQELFVFAPHLFCVQGLLPRVAQAEAAMTHTILLLELALSRTQKLFLLFAVASAYRNTYCIEAGREMLRHCLGVSDHQLDEIIKAHQASRSMPDTALLDFALKLATNAHQLSEGDIVALRERGFTDEAILEAVLVTALSHFLCTLSVGLDLSPDFKHRAVLRQSPALAEQHPYSGAISGSRLRKNELSPAGFPPFLFFLEWFGFIPPIFYAQTLWPDVIAAEADLVRTVLAPEHFLSHRQKGCILLVNSAANRNACCLGIHKETLRAWGVSVEEFSQMTADHRQADISVADKALLDFTRKLAVRSFEFDSKDVNGLRRHGFTEEQILEAVVTTALNSFFHTLQAGLGATPEMESKRVWEPPDAPRPVGSKSSPCDGQLDPDTVLVMQAQNGNLAAFDELVARHNRRVYGMITAIIGNVEEAQDTMQDTFLKAFAHIGGFQGRSKFSTWLMSIASNMALQRLRTHKRWEHFSEIGDESELRSFTVRAWEADPEQLYSQAERRRLVESGLMKLPAKYRTVLVLRDIEQLSTEEAATALGLGIPALKARLFRARKMLREALSPHFMGSVQKMNSL